MILVDTSVLIDHLRGRPEALHALSRVATEHIAASVLTKTEILAGMRSPERFSVRRLLASLTWVTVTDEIAERAGEYAREFRASHAHIDVVDFVIAATAHQANADLWTRNVRHFPMFQELTSPY